MRRAVRGAVLAGAMGVALATTPAAADVGPAEDDPPGCTTAHGEDDPYCGAQGRDHFGNADHRPPVEACADSVDPEAGSRITRILPDGPRRPDGALAFVSGVCVYLPPGYDDGALRYPVLYLLHGGGGDQADWVTSGRVRELLDAAYAADPAGATIVVMPDGRSGHWFDHVEGAFRNETYVLRHLVPAIDARFRTIADRSGRAIAGLSNGGYGALHLAAKAPDLFVAAGSMSGNLGARLMNGLGDAGGPYYQANVPFQLASNLDGVDVIVDWGATCTSDLLVDACGTWVFEQAFRLDTIAFRDRLVAVGHQGAFDYREAEGSHAWRWWTEWLVTRDLPFFRARLAPARPVDEPVARTPVPASFRYRSAFPRFSVWGYDVAVERGATEFLDLTDVGLRRLTVAGSGVVTITTAPRYRPGARYSVGDEVVAADAAGRVRITVDLGAGSTRTVSIAPQRRDARDRTAR